MLFPVELLVRWHIFCPITPIKDEQGDSRLIVGQRRVEVSLEVSRVLLPIGTFCQARAPRGQIVGLYPGQGRRIIRSNLVLLCDDLADSILDYVRQDRVRGIFRTHQVDQGLDRLHGKLVDLIVVRPDHGTRRAALYNGRARCRGHLTLHLACRSRDLCDVDHVKGIFIDFIF